MKELNLGKDKINKLILAFSVPCVISMLINSVYNIVDQIFIGKGVGTLGNAATNVIFPLVIIFNAIAGLIGNGAAANLSLKLGENKKDEAAKSIGQAVSLTVLVSVIISVFAYIFLPQLVYLFGCTKSVYKYAVDYGRIIIIGAPFMIIYSSLSSIIRADGAPKYSMIMLVVGAIINIILDPIFIFGFGMGIKGAALGTVICQLVICLWSTYYFTKGKSNLKLRLKNIRIESKIIKGILVIALTQFCMELSAGFIHLITNKVLKLYGGDLAIGAMTAITSINLLFYMPVFGISQGMQTIIAYNYGAKQFDRAKKALSIGMIGAIGILSLGLIATRLFPEILIGIFTKDATLMELALNGISIYSLTLPAVGICILGAVYFQSIGNAKMSIVLSLLRQVIVFIPLILLIPKLLGLNGVWAAQPLADIISTLIIVGFLIKEFKVDSVRELSYR